MKYLEELGKGLINFANIGTVIIFLKAFIDNFDYNYLVSRMIFFIGFYTFGVKLIKKAEENSNGK